MTSKFSNKFLIPNEFPKILHDYAKEVIRNQPKDILDFSFQYFYLLEQKLSLNNNNEITIIDVKETTEKENIKLHPTKFPINLNSQEFEEKKTGNIKTNEHINSEENRKSNLESNRTNGSGVVGLSKNFVNELIESKGIENELYNKTGETFNNISVTSEDKNGIRNFVGNVLEDAYKYELEQENQSK